MKYDTPEKRKELYNQIVNKPCGPSKEYIQAVTNNSNPTLQELQKQIQELNEKIDKMIVPK